MIIALFPNAQKKTSLNLALGIREFLLGKGVEVVVEDKAAQILEVPPLSSVPLNKIKFAISMGGDGTILRLAHEHPDLDAPIFGINLGHLGFLADVPLSDIYPSLQDLLAGAYRIENRLVVEGVAAHSPSTFAVNDIVIHRGTNPGLIELAIHVDGTYVNTFAADGLIIATPGGSTAYSLAAGGPILTPELRALVLTPICPHTISNRPIVFCPEQEVQIQYLSEYSSVDVAFDGVVHHPLKTSEVCKVTLSKRTFKLVSLLRHNYFATLRSKLTWSGGKLRH